MNRTRIVVVLAIAVGLASFGASCKKKAPEVVFTSPSASSVFTNAATIEVTGRVQNVAASAISEVTVNGVDVTPLGPGNSFSAVISLDPGAVFNPVLAEARLTNNKRLRDRLTVIAGDGVTTGYVLDGDFSPEGVALRLNDTGLDEAEPVVEDGVDINLATLLPVGTYLLSFTAVWNFNVYVTTPAPRYGGFGIDIDSQTNSVDGDIDFFRVGNIPGVEVNVFLDGTGFLAPDCTARVATENLEVNGNYALSPDPVDPSLIDVNQNGPLDFGNTSFSVDITSGFTCEVGAFFGLIGDNVEEDIINGLAGLLNDPDGAGPQDGPIADEIELALAEIEISGPLGEALDINLETPLFDVYENTAGITLDSDVRMTALNPHPQAPDLTASYHVEETFPSFGALSPGGLPYDLALAISSSGFNQLLKASVENGLLRLTGGDAITQFDIDGEGGQDPVELTAGFLTVFIPQLSGLDPNLLMKIEIKPVVAPVFTGNDGPLGELAEIRIAHLLFELRRRHATQDLYVSAVIDVATGTDITFTPGVPPDPGQLNFVLSAPAAEDIEVTIVENAVNTQVNQLQQTLEFLLPELLPGLSDTLGAFPIPDFLGLSLSPVEVTRAGDYIGLFVDLSQTP